MIVTALCNIAAHKASCAMVKNAETHGQVYLDYIYAFSRLSAFYAFLFSAHGTREIGQIQSDWHHHAGGGGEK